MYSVSPAPLRDIDAWLDRFRRWFLPVSGDLRLGGRFQIEGNASGTIERCDPPKGFTATWEYGGSVSWIELSLSPAAEGRTVHRRLCRRRSVARRPPWDGHLVTPGSRRILLLADPDSDSGAAGAAD